jgi:hypothetical protein
MAKHIEKFKRPFILIISLRMYYVLKPVTESCALHALVHGAIVNM